MGNDDVEFISTVVSDHTITKHCLLLSILYVVHRILNTRLDQF